VGVSGNICVSLTSAGLNNSLSYKKLAFRQKESGLKTITFFASMIQEKSKKSNHPVPDGFGFFNWQNAKNATSQLGIEFLLTECLIARGDFPFLIFLALFRFIGRSYAAT
jgi:hypothetical protein